MGKWYSVPNYVRHKLEKKHYYNCDDPTQIEFYYPWVENVARSFPTASMAIGCLTINDLIQSGYVGLVEAWSKVDLDKSQAEVWSFLKTRIKFAIRQDINKYANTIKIPERMLREASKHMKAHEKIIVNIFPRFFDETVFVDAEINVNPWDAKLLGDLIEDEMQRVILNVDHRDITKKFYGVDFDKKSQKELAEEYRLNPNNIGQIVNRTVKKMNNSEFEKIIENFYENQ